jgi:hypothetical protein
LHLRCRAAEYAATGLFPASVELEVYSFILRVNFIGVKRQD